MKLLFPCGLIGSLAAALFCGTTFTPLLVAFLAALGLRLLHPDLVVIPALIGFLIVATSTGEFGVAPAAELHAADP